MPGLISLADAKRHLRILHEDDDTYIQDLIDAASKHVERLCGATSPAGARTIQLDAFPARIKLRLWPVRLDSIVITYLDGNGAEQPFTDFRAVVIDDAAVICPAIGMCWPRHACAPGAVAVTAMIGVDEDDAECPDNLKHAVRLCVGSWYRNREEAVATATARLPDGFKVLVEDERMLRV